MGCYGLLWVGYGLLWVANCFKPYLCKNQLIFFKGRIMPHRAARIKEKLQKEFSPNRLEIINESQRHRGHGGDDGSGESHFRIKIGSAIFANLSRIESHRLINDSLANEFQKGLHALAIEII